MSDILKPPVKAMFHEHEVKEGQFVTIPQHQRVNATGDKLKDICPSTSGMIVLDGGIPTFKPKAECIKRKDQSCFFVLKD
jgi:hypothetical protein